jgi:hypothetical protein
MGASNGRALAGRLALRDEVEDSSYGAIPEDFLSRRTSNCRLAPDPFQPPAQLGESAAPAAEPDHKPGGGQVGATERE